MDDRSGGILLAGIDAFTSVAFQGNPAAVCLLPAEAAAPSDSWMQSMATELNTPATALLRPRDAGSVFDLRWFTTTRELELCGHGTLAAAHYLFEAGMLEPGREALFHTRSGDLAATQNAGWIELNFPAKAVVEVETPAGLQVAIGESEILFTGMNGLDLLVELGSEEAVRELTPNLERLASIDVRGVIVTARGSGEYDCVSRFFAPRMGLPEDQVTGSAHCALAPYWMKKSAKDTLLAYQASARGGVLRLGVSGDRVRLGGQAVTMWRGRLT